MYDEFRIVKIIDEYRIVVDAKCDDVKKGDLLEVYEPGDEIRDPETGELLGTLDYIKAVIEVEDVLPRMCVCRNHRTKTVPGNTMAIVQAMQGFTTKEVISPLPVHPEDISGGYDGVEKRIRIGDSVRKCLS